MATTERIGDYVLFPAFATGGAATVHLGRLVRGVGFERLVVVKRLHAQLAGQAEAADRLLREARVSARVRSPYVVPTLDVVRAEGELCLVMEFVHGVTLGRLLELASAQGKLLEPSVVVTIVGHVLRGLHAAHEATSEDGMPLELVHRDVSPQNVLVGSDGLARILDFGIAKALGHKALTASIEVRGTLAYMAPEQVRGGLPVTRQADLHAVGVLLWEALTGARLRPMANVEELVASLGQAPPPPSERRPGLPRDLDAVVLRALRHEPVDRFPTAQAMLAELEAAVVPASTDDVIRAAEAVAFEELELLRELVARCERGTSEARPAAALPTSGAIVGGRYRIGDVLGSGAMGLVFAAEEQTTGTQVAIKVVQADRVGDERAMKRMLREAKASQKLAGQHVVRVLDVGMEQAFAYLVMERLDGRDLRALLAAEGRMPVDVAVLYALHACDALAEAHALGVVHRDLKPANLFLTRSPDGSPLVKVLDFGIAKETRDEDDASRSLTASAVVLGSPAYMSPEQIRSPNNVDARTDVWALGVVLYELLAGSLPFAGDTAAAVLASVSADGWIPIRSVRPDVPRDLALLLERCLTKAPSERTASMVAVAAELIPLAPPGYVAGEHLLQARSPSQRTSRLGRRGTFAGAVAGAALVIVAAGVAARARGPAGPPTLTSAAAAISPAPTAPAERPPQSESTSSASATPAGAPAPSDGANPATATSGKGDRRSTPRARPPVRPVARGTAEAVPPNAPPVQTSAPKLDPTAEFR